MAKLLVKERQALVDQWLQRVLDDPDIPTANKLARPALEDSIPMLIDRIIEKFETRHLAGESEISGRHAVGTKEIGATHARHRFDVHYTAEETTRELSVFREVLLELCDASSITLTLDESKLVHLAIDEMMAANAHEVEQTVFRRSEQVMAIVAHDLRNPVHIVDGYAQLLKTNPPVDPVAVGEAIERSTRQMARLIEDLLAMSTLEPGHMSINQQWADARDPVNAVLEQFRHAASRKRIAMMSYLPEDDVPIGCDPVRIEQAIGNVISNALKFTPAGGRVWVVLERAETHVIFRVCDTGPGIPPEQREHVFRPFWQDDKFERHGVGLGLAIVRGIVKAHEGSVSVDEAPGGGAMISIMLPMGEHARPSKSFALDVGSSRALKRRREGPA